MRIGSSALGVAAALLLAWGPASGSPYQLGVWADAERASGCVEVPPGGTFTLHGWCFVPGSSGLAYATYRFRFPANVERHAAPSLPGEVVDLIITDFADGTQEWNLVVTGCPPGWVEVFTQACTALDGLPAVIAIVEDPCWLRDCTFALHGVTVAGEVGVNDPGCGGVPARPGTWGLVKGLYR